MFSHYMGWGKVAQLFHDTLSIAPQVLTAGFPLATHRVFIGDAAPLVVIHMSIHGRRVSCFAEYCLLGKLSSLPAVGLTVAWHLGIVFFKQYSDCWDLYGISLRCSVS